MFPLGTVLFPHQTCPLHVFEPRYRELTLRCLEGDRRFGVVLIERGHEVGGGDIRFDVGTVAEIVQAARLPDGRFVLETSGRERFRVDEWLPDAPHPVADVTFLEDMPRSERAAGLLAESVESLRRLLALRAELGEPAPPATFDLDPEPEVASWQACFLAGLTPIDALEILRVDDPELRLTLLRDLVRGEIEWAQVRLRQA